MKSDSCSTLFNFTASLKRTAKFMFAGFAGLWLSAVVAGACGFHSELPGHGGEILNSSNDDYRMMIWERLGGAKFDATQKTEIPIHLSFTPILGYQTSPILGQGFRLMPFDATFVQKDGDTFEMTQPSGYVSTLWKTRDPHVLKGGGWMAKVSGSGTGQVITAESSCGWTITYNAGRLARMTSPSKEVFDFLTDPKGSRQVNRDGRKLMTLRRDFDPKTTLPLWHLDFPSLEGPKHAVLKMGYRQILVTLPNKTTRQEGRRALASIQFDNEPERRYNFKIDELDRAGHVYKWDPANWNLVASGKKRYELLRVQGILCRKTTYEDGLFSIHGRDPKRGISISTAPKGETIVTERFTAGVAMGNEKKIYTLDASGKEQIRRQCWYDEYGKVLRMLRNDGDESILYERTGATVRAIDNKAKNIIWEKRHDAKSRVVFFKYQDSEYHFDYKEDGSEKVILSTKGQNSGTIQKEISLNTLTALLKDFEFGRF